MRLPDGTMICAVLSKFSAEADSGTLTLTRPGHAPLRWYAEASTLNDSADIEVLQADLDGDGTTDLVIAALTAVSNGLGVPYWSITIVNGRENRTPQRVEVEEYNTAGSWVRFAGQPGCHLLYTSWQTLTLDPHRGEGMYLVGEIWPYAAGALAHEIQPEGRARRLLNSFAAQRARDSFNETRDAPLRWLTDRRALPLQVPVVTPVDHDSLVLRPRQPPN
jgi:hypothetical protein